MRFAIFAGAVGLLAVSTASAQPVSSAPPLSSAEAGTAPAPLFPNTTALPTPSDPPPPNPYENFATAPTNPWAMNGPRAWVNAEYLLWWVTPMNTPPLIQTVPTGAALGAFGSGSSLPPGSAMQAFPDSRQLQLGAYSGARISTGINFDEFGLEGSVLFLPQRTVSSSLFNNGTPYSIAESYVRAGTGQPISLLASLPGQAAGGITSSVSSQLWGADANVRLPFFNFLTDTTDALVGFRYLDLQEKLSTNFQSSLNTGANLQIQDSVQTHNQFYGGQFGLNAKINGIDRGLGLDATGKMALGGVVQSATLEGSNSIMLPGQPASVQPGGLYTSGANAGTFTRDKIAMLYEQNVNITYNFNRWSQIYVGYSIIWISSVMRPGEAINTTVNDSNLRFVANPPANNSNPQFMWKANDFWAQGITFGLRVQY